MNNRKKSITKKLSVLFLMMFALIIISPFALKPQNAFAYNCRGNHTWGSWQITKSATCYSTGTKKRKCTKCGATSTVTTNKTNHNWVGWYTSKYPTCTSTGTKYQYCKMCSQRQYATIPALGHVASSSWTTQKAATCSSNGLAVCICSRSNCNYIVSQKSIPKTNAHSFVNGRCTSCGQNLSSIVSPKYYIAKKAFANQSEFKGNIDPTIYETAQYLKLNNKVDNSSLFDTLHLNGSENKADFVNDGIKLVFHNDGSINAYLRYEATSLNDILEGDTTTLKWREYATGKMDGKDIVLYPVNLEKIRTNNGSAIKVVLKDDN